MGDWFKDSSSRNNLRNNDFGNFQKRRRRSGFFNNLNVTGWLITLNIAFFIGAMSLMTFFGEKILYAIAIQPTAFFEQGYIWTLITSMFMHGGIGHLLINMFVLFSLGGLCEKIIGRKRFLWFYLLSGIFAGLMFVFLAYFFGTTDIGARIFGSPLDYAVGASGAIFAIAGLFVMLTPRLKFMIIFLPFFSLPAFIMIPLVLFLTWIVSAGTGLPVGNTAHFGGFLIGIIYGAYLRKKYSRKVKMIGEMFQ